MGIRAAAAAAQEAQEALEKEQRRAVQREHIKAAEAAVLEMLGLRGKCIKAYKTEPECDRYVTRGWGHGATVRIEDEEDGLVIELRLTVSDAGTRTQDYYGNTIGVGTVTTYFCLTSVNGRAAEYYGDGAGSWRITTLAGLGRALAQHERNVADREARKRAHTRA
jgi:hypothetical protein